MWDNPKSVESAIRRLTREIEEIERFFTGQMKKTTVFSTRDDVVRSTVLQMHTAIEDLLNSCLASNITGASRRGRSQSARTQSTNPRGVISARAGKGPYRGNINLPYRIGSYIMKGLQETMGGHAPSRTAGTYRQQGEKFPLAEQLESGPHAIVPR